jgi:hypothetical protein
MEADMAMMVLATGLVCAGFMIVANLPSRHPESLFLVRPRG